VNWRWQRAQWLLAHRRNYSPRRDDEQTGRALCFLRALARCSCLKGFSDIQGALQLYKNNEPIKLLVEARILARQTSPEIARLTGVPVGVVDSYEAIFFHVQDRLNARDWILVQAIEKGANDQTEPRAGAILKRFAFYGGPLVLNAVAPYLVGGKDLFAPLDLSTAEGRREQAIRLAVATEMLPNDAETNAKLVKIMLILTETAHKAPVGHALVSFLAQNVDSMLKELAAEALSKRPDKQETRYIPEPASNSGQVA